MYAPSFLKYLGLTFFLKKVCNIKKNRVSKWSSHTSVGCNKTYSRWICILLFSFLSMTSWSTFKKSPNIAWYVLSCEAFKKGINLNCDYCKNLWIDWSHPTHFTIQLISWFYQRIYLWTFFHHYELVIKQLNRGKTIISYHFLEIKTFLKWLSMNI